MGTDLVERKEMFERARSFITNISDKEFQD